MGKWKTWSAMALVLLGLLPAGSGPAIPLPLEQAVPLFDVQHVATEARNRIRAEGDLLVAENAAYRAEFTPAGLRYVPKIDGQAVVDYALSYELRAVHAGLDAHSVAAAAPSIAGADRVEYARDRGMVEAYVAMDTGVEQLFVLNEPPAAGDLTLLGCIESQLTPEIHPSGGFRFLDGAQQVVRYGQAVAFDATGAKVAVEARMLGGELALVVPGEWLAAADYPVAIDPFISGDILISVAEDHQRCPALAYNDDDDEWLVVWHDIRDGVEYDIYGQRVDIYGTIQGAPIVIWDSDDILFNPSVAYDTTQGRYLVVWQNDTNPAVEGRVLNADGSFFSDRVQMTTGLVARSRPDAAYNSTANQYLVVWEYETAGDNHDIWGRKVEVDGTMDGGTFVINDAAANELTPSLVANPTAGGEYLVVWSSDRSGTYNVVGHRLESDASLVGATFKISSGSGDETQPDLALNADNGQYFVVWEDNRSDAGDIYGRLVNADGSGGSGLVVNGETGHQHDPAVAYNMADGEYLVIWEDALVNICGQRVDADANPVADSVFIAEGGQRDGAVAFGTDRYLVVWADDRSGYSNIVGQRLSRTGELVGYEIGLSPALHQEYFPALAYGTELEQWLVVWHDGRRGVGVYGQSVTHEGVLAGEPIAVGSGGTGQHEPDVAYNPDDDQFLVVWHDSRDGDDNIYGQRVNASDGTLEGGGIQITSQEETQWYPAVAYNHLAGQYLVIWGDWRDGENDWNIYGRRLERDGTFYDASVFVICARPDLQTAVDVVFNPVQGQYLVVWADSSLADGGIAAQRVRATDPPLVGYNVDICADSSRRQWDPAVTCNTTNGEYLVVWNDEELSADYDIYGRRVSGSGELLGTSDIAISTADNDQRLPHVDYDPSQDRYYACWDDERYGDTGPDIFGQALSASGSLLFTTAETNAPVWVYPGEQRRPAVAGDPADGRGLVVWQDGRNGEGSEIYGRLGDPAAFMIFLPVVVQDN